MCVLMEVGSERLRSPSLPVCCPHALWTSPIPSVKGRPSSQRLGPNAWRLWTPCWPSHPTSRPSAHPPTSTCNQTLSAFLSSPAGAAPSSPQGPARQWQLPPCLAQTPFGGCPCRRVKPRSHGALYLGLRPLWPQSCSLGLALRLPHRPPRSACPASGFSSLWNVCPPVPTCQSSASGFPRGSASQRPPLTAGS